MSSWWYHVWSSIHLYPFVDHLKKRLWGIHMIYLIGPEAVDKPVPYIETRVQERQVQAGEGMDPHRTAGVVFL